MQQLLKQGNRLKFIIICTDYTQGKVFSISANGKEEWEYPAENCNDVWILPGGNLLFNTGKGVKEVTLSKRN